MKSNKKKVWEWIIIALPENIMLKAIKNSSQIRLNVMTHKHTALSWAFYWGNTKEGFTYWNNIAYKYFYKCK